jgi:glycosyltransferase involved in cell wall biosynthesis
LKSPLISIITITLNAEIYLEQTIQSVLNQTYKNIEYIIVDGGSTDGTLGVIEKYKNAIDHIISEKDEGIADAMNKGVSLASGDYIIFLHADDYFHHDTCLEESIKFLEVTTDILACRIQFGKDQKIITPTGFNFWTNFKGMPHQGILCRRSLIESLHGFDTQFKICMDYDLLLRAYQNGARLKKAPVVLSVMRDTGISSLRDWKNLRFRFAEEKRVHEKNCRSLLMGVLYKIYWLLYLPYRRLSYVTILGKDRS